MTSPSGTAHQEQEPRGVLVWFASRPVAANLLMMVLLLGGLFTIPRIGKEVFPRAELDMVTVTVPYPGASPAEVEQGVVRAIEEEVRALEGVKEVRSISAEGQGTVTVELLLGTDKNEMLGEVESAVDRITSFPEDAEEPTVSLVTNRRQVISVVYYGDVPETTLKQWAERARDALLDDPDITFVELTGTRPREISIEVPRQVLRRYNLTLTGVADRVRATSIDLPAGEIEAQRGDIALRTTEREETAAGFAQTLLVAEPEGAQVRLGEVAQIRDGFRDVDQASFFNGLPAVRVDVYRVGDEEPLEVSRAVEDFVERERGRLPPSINLATWNDQSQIYGDRMTLLMKNAYIGLGLVLLLLAMFLAPRLAFWVTLGIPISFLGALLFLPAANVTINLISLFAFIVALGLVVDDAIVVGEAIYRQRQQGESRRVAAINGVREVARPVLFSITTTCIAFTPMLFVPGVAGQFFRNIPIVVILALAASLVESLLVLPAHLSHRMPRLLDLVLRPLFWLMDKARFQRVSEWLDGFVERRYTPAARVALRFRYTTVAAGLLLLLGAAGLQAGGRLNFRFLPRIEDDQVRATLEMPVGTPFERTRELQERLVRAAREVAEEADPDMLQGIYSETGILRRLSETSAMAPEGGSHAASVTVDLVAAGQRELRSSEFSRRWRERVGEIRGARTLEYNYSTGATEGAPISIELSHPDIDTLEQAAIELARALGRYENVLDVDDGVTYGKERIDFTLTETGRAHGFTDQAFARELRAGFFGAEAQRFQRERDEVRVYVRLPDSERQSLEDLTEIVLQTPRGGEMPIRRVADLHWDRAETRITRTDLRRTLNVTAHVQGDVTAGEITADLQQSTLPALKDKYPGLQSGQGGQQQSQAEAISSLGAGFLLALVVIFGLLAVAFQSYVQPLIVLTAIPFGMVGAVLGHLLLGYDLSLSSMFGLVALSGVVVNDSLLMVDAINGHRQQRADAGAGVEHGSPALFDAVVAGGARRFRPVLMTSLTTFGGLTPMMFETSVQAQFLIPMALSLGFGILFATLVLVFIVPSLYLIVEDLRRHVIAGLDRLLPEREPETRRS